MEFVSYVAPVMLAHQGGWDEILMFAVPVLLAVWAIRRIERKGKHTADDGDAEGAARDEQTDPHPTDAD